MAAEFELIYYDVAAKFIDQDKRNQTIFVHIIIVLLLDPCDLEIFC